MTLGKDRRKYKEAKHLKKLIAVVFTWVFLVAMVVAVAPIVASTETDTGGIHATPEQIEANALFYGHCSGPK